MIPVWFLDEFDSFVDPRGTDRSEEIRAAYRNHIDDPPSIEAVLDHDQRLSDEAIMPRDCTKVMMSTGLLRDDVAFREGDPDDPEDDGRGTDRSPEICAAMANHMDEPPAVATVTDDPAARMRAAERQQ